MYEYQVLVHLSGGTLYHLATVQTPEALGALLTALTACGEPQYSTIEIRIVPRG